MGSADGVIHRVDFVAVAAVVAVAVARDLDLPEP